MSAPDALSELEGLEREATPGPWGLHEPDCHWIATVGDFTISPFHECSVGVCCDNSAEADAALIAALRNAAPQLLAVARAAAVCYAGYTREMANWTPAVVALLDALSPLLSTKEPS